MNAETPRTTAGPVPPRALDEMEAEAKALGYPSALAKAAADLRLCAKMERSQGHLGSWQALLDEWAGVAEARAPLEAEVAALREAERGFYVLAKLVEAAHIEVTGRRLNVAVRVAITEARNYAAGGYSSGRTRELEEEWALLDAGDAAR